ncbi:MAG: hypothetical protein HQM07_09220, partial [Zetaproteobacteria bacterium]|nr:hypothetical protein [Zetaproteobacteria bacterium]
MKTRIKLITLSITTVFLLLSSIFSVIAATNWQWVNPMPQGLALNAVAHGNLTTVAVGDRGTIVTSSDGIHWIPQNSGTQENLRGAAWNGRKFVVVGDNSAIFSSSDAGVTWTQEITPLAMPTQLNGIIWSGQQFVAVG